MQNVLSLCYKVSMSRVVHKIHSAHTFLHVSNIMRNLWLRMNKIYKIKNHWTHFD